MNNGLSIGRYLWRRPERLDSCLFCKGRGEVQQLDGSWWNWDILDIPINKRCKSLNFRIRYFYVVNFDGYIRDLNLNVIFEDQHDTLCWFRRIGSTIFLSVLNPGVVDNISTHRFTCYVSAKRVSNDSPKLIFKGKYLGLLNACKKICVNYWNSQECHFNMFWTGANRKWEYRLYEWQ